MIDDPFASPVETVAGPAPTAATTGPASCGGDALVDDDRLADSPPRLDQRGSPSGPTAQPALAAATHSICEADVRAWFG